MTIVKNAKKGRVKVVRGEPRWYLRCEQCKKEYNVSPFQRIGDRYLCPQCDK